MIINSSNVIRKFPPLATGLIILLIISSMLLIYLASLVQFSCSVMSNSLQPHWLQHARPPCPSPNPGVTQTHVHWVGDAIQPLTLCHPLLLPSIFPSIRVFSNESVLCICCFLTCIQISQGARQVVWYSHILKNFPQFVVVQTVKGFGIDNKWVFSNTTVPKHQFFSAQLSL